MGDMLTIPLDDPPPASLIGDIAYRSIKALNQGDCELADAIAEKGLKDETLDWATGEPLAPTVLQVFFNQFAHAAAWSQHPTFYKKVRAGLPAMHRLYRKIAQYVRRNDIDFRHPEWEAWRYLLGSTLGMTLAYFVGKHGIGWFSESKVSHITRFKTQHADVKVGRRAHLRVLAQRLIAKLLIELGDIHEWKAMYSGEYMVTRIAWNFAQLAALADRADLFNDCVVALHEKHYRNFRVVEAALRDDEDTGPMMDAELLQATLASFKRRGATTN